MATRSFEPSPRDLRELVIDYLLHNAYIDTATAFAAESAVLVHASEIREGLSGDMSASAPATPRAMVSGGASEQTRDASLSEEELDLVRKRREIKLHILSGRVDEAVQLLNTYFPAVLQENDSEIPMQKPPAPSNLKSPFARLNYTSQLSVKPVHIALNLRILAFIEAARTVPLPYPGDPKRPSTATPGANAAVDPSGDAYSAHQTALLHRAQRLYAAVESLRDTRDRDVYRKELNQVGGLLAYTVPEASPIAKYLSQERREAVADQVNSAILHHIGKPAASHIELYARQTSTVMSVMRDNSIPASAQMQSFLRAEAVEQLPTSLKGINGKAEKGEGVDSEKPPTCPTFNLREFLNNS